MNHPGTVLQTLTEKLVASKEGVSAGSSSTIPNAQRSVAGDVGVATTARRVRERPDVRVIILRGAG